jgi:hypothetical protein
VVRRGQPGTADRRWLAGYQAQAAQLAPPDLLSWLHSPGQSHPVRGSCPWWLLAVAANGVPAFRQPRARRAQRTELMLGALLGTMLIGLSVLIRREHVAPRGGVTVLTQLTAGSFGTGWAYYAANIAVTLVLALAANTSFGGLPVLMSLLSADDRLPHLLGLLAERPVHRYGVVALAVLAGVLLIAVNAITARLIPLYAIGVFIGFTISQTGLVRHWHGQRAQHAALTGQPQPPGLVPRALQQRIQQPVIDQLTQRRQPLPGRRGFSRRKEQHPPEPGLPPNCAPARTSQALAV